MERSGTKQGCGRTFWIDTPTSLSLDVTATLNPRQAYMAKTGHGHSKEGKPLPICKAILLCERTIVTPETWQLDLIGIVRHLHIPAELWPTEPMELFVQLVDGVGQYQIAIEIIDLAEDRSIARGKGPKVFFPDQLALRQLILPLPALPLTHSGVYDVIVFANGHEVDRQQFTVSFATESGGSTL